MNIHFTTRKTITTISLMFLAIILLTTCSLLKPGPETYTNEQSLTEITMKQEPQVRTMNKMSLKEHARMYWKFFFEKAEKFPRSQLPQEKVNMANLYSKRSNTLKSAWLGHSSILMNVDGNIILTDPLFERKVSVVGPTRFANDYPLDIDELAHVDVVIISHNHYDHLNKFSIQRLKDKAGVFIVPLRVGNQLIKWGVSPEKVIELGWWEDVTVSKHLTITATPSQHFSGRTPFDSNRTLWASWVIAGENHKVFFSGDSGYFEGFKTIGDKHGPFDVTFLECGAYNEAWSNIHMFPEETAQAFIDLKGKTLQPIHWGTFNLALHNWYEPIERLLNASIQNNLQISAPTMGRVIDYDQPVQLDMWWIEAMVVSKEASKPAVAGI